MATILDGARVAKEIKRQIRKEVDDMMAADYLVRPPRLVTILVGDDPASRVYVRNKVRDCEECGFTSGTIELSQNTTRGKLLDFIDCLNKDPNVDGILCQLPLPEGLDEWDVLNAIDPAKDVDCFHPENAGKLAAGHPVFAPCTPAGVMRLLAEYGIPIYGRHCVVIGRSNIVGKPMAQLLTAADGTVTICHSKTRNLARYTRDAGLLVSDVVVLIDEEGAKAFFCDSIGWMKVPEFLIKREIRKNGIFSIHVCPNHCEALLTTSAHVAQTWKVDALGNFVDEVSNDDIVSGPDDGNIWECEECGAEAELVECQQIFIVDGEIQGNLYMPTTPRGCAFWIARGMTAAKYIPIVPGERGIPCLTIDGKVFYLADINDA